MANSVLLVRPSNLIDRVARRVEAHQQRERLDAVVAGREVVDVVVRDRHLAARRARGHLRAAGARHRRAVEPPGRPSRRAGRSAAAAARAATARPALPRRRAAAPRREPALLPRRRPSPASPAAAGDAARAARGRPTVRPPRSFPRCSAAPFPPPRPITAAPVVPVPAVPLPPVPAVPAALPPVPPADPAEPGLPSGSLAAQPTASPSRKRRRARASSARHPSCAMS